MEQFNSFSEAFSYLIDNSGYKMSHFYHQIGMDASQFNKYYTAEIKTPQADTRNKLNALVGQRIIKKGKKWEIKDPEDQNESITQSTKEELDTFFQRIAIIESLYKGTARQFNLPNDQKEELFKMTKMRLKELLYRL